ncbi:MAG TPA: SUMF1/EgtB/PvdO family nonheme iron enzyme, partial [Phycisphaerales bacterium]|nr:SUMF1/EgtB/PvdO family nonheme iron enzyme [Phycisphaerales bacterium]
AHVENATIDHRTDVFSLGVVLYELLSRNKPFAGNTPQEVFKSLAEGRPKNIRLLNSSIDSELATICHKAIEKSPKDRYPTAAHMAGDLRCWLSDSPILARPPGLRRRIRRAMKSRKTVFGMISTAVLVAIVTILAYRFITDDRPRIDTSALPDDAKVYLCRFNDTSGQVSAPVLLGGRSGLFAFRADAGFYRVFIVDSKHRSAELSRWLVNGQLTTITANLVDAKSVEDSMVAIPAGAATFADKILTGDAPQEYVNRVGKLPPFLIDRFEVTNAEYAKFLQATGTTPPEMWDGPNPPEGWDDLPACGLTHDEAQRYAEWCGKRLPTRDEWERAARGPHGWIYPWGNSIFGNGTGTSGVEPKDKITKEEREELARRAYIYHYDSLMMGQGYAGAEKGPKGPEREKYFDVITSHLCKARSLEGHEDIGPEGLVHALGNVSEWSDTIRGVNDNGEKEYYLCGGLWAMAYINFSTDLSMHMMRPENMRMVGLGFRCAKSVVPEGMQ